MIVGVQKHYGANDTISVNGVLMKQTDIVAKLQAPITASDTTAASEAAFHKAVADEDATEAAADATYKGLKATLVPQYAGSTDSLADYGLSVTVKRVPSAATVAAAVEKRKATLAARGVVGKRKRAAITAPAPAAATPAAGVTPPASPATTPKS
jgi:hypothetical protein